MSDLEKILALEIHINVLENFVNESVNVLLPLHNRKWDEKLKLLPGDKLHVQGVKALIAYAEKLEQELALKNQ